VGAAADLVKPAALVEPATPGEFVLTITTENACTSTPPSTKMVVFNEPSLNTAPPPKPIATTEPTLVTVNIGPGPTPGASMLKAYCPGAV
jgi:hypothetical protein